MNENYVPIGIYQRLSFPIWIASDYKSLVFKKKQLINYLSRQAV